ncbi:hypothetical protein LXL04_035788 [Taraxacum kok-saghyz]
MFPQININIKATRPKLLPSQDLLGSKFCKETIPSSFASSIAMGDASQSGFKPLPVFQEVARAPVIERWALLKLHMVSIT